MLRTLLALSMACIAITSASAATDPFVGDWKLNPSRSHISDQMKVNCIESNKCVFNLGPVAETIVLDGTDQPGEFGTTLAVAVEAPDRWKVMRKKDGHLMISAIWSLSSDANTLIDDFTSIRSDGTTNNIKYTYKRSGPGTGFTATWIGTPQAMTSPVVLQIRPYEEDGLSFSDSRGQDTNNVKFDGKDYLHSGPNSLAGFVSSGHRSASHSIELTDKVSGTLLRTRRLELSPDGKTLSVTVQIPGRTEPDTQVFERQ
ncbi:MAG: hypothetical protein JST28_13560 [Acidobacteria bacterium]|nr:hypothetical protein [Acidobacteriota bacterium]